MACRLHNFAAMKTVVLGTCLLLSVSAKAAGLCRAMKSRTAGSPRYSNTDAPLAWTVSASTILTSATLAPESVESAARARSAGAVKRLAPDRSIRNRCTD